MKESDYLVVQRLTKMRAAWAILRGCIFNSPPDIARYDTIQREIHELTGIDEARIDKIGTVDEEG